MTMLNWWVASRWWSDDWAVCARCPCTKSNCKMPNLLFEFRWYARTQRMRAQRNCGTWKHFTVYCWRACPFQIARTHRYWPYAYNIIGLIEKNYLLCVHQQHTTHGARMQTADIRTRRTHSDFAFTDLRMKCKLNKCKSFLRMLDFSIHLRSHTTTPIHNSACHRTNIACVCLCERKLPLPIRFYYYYLWCHVMAVDILYYINADDRMGFDIWFVYCEFPSIFQLNMPSLKFNQIGV